MEAALRTIHLWSRFVNFQQDWSGPDFQQRLREGEPAFRLSAEALSRRLVMSEEMSPEDRTKFSTSLNFLQLHRQALIKEYATGHLDVLELRAEVQSTLSISKLIELINSGSDSHFDGRRRFEAVSMLDIATFMLAIDQDDSNKNVGRDLNRLLELLDAHLFASESRTVTVWTRHDPADHYRVKEVSAIDVGFTGSQQNVRRNGITCRQLNTGGLVLVHERSKYSFDTWRKIQRQLVENQSDPFLVGDRCGIKFVVPSKSDAHALAERIQEIGARIGAEVGPFQGNLSGNGRMDNGNKLSSPFFRAIKSQVVWGPHSYRRHYEIQIVPFLDYFSSRFALNEENHDLYKLRQCIEVFFPLLFPLRIYGINWRNHKVREPLFRAKTQQLGWSVKK
ncbi:hypothetical protein KJ611_02740 [Patescibacteria group bacterium]|nr:hypothetical protein [Patescibacteria group bacterium]MBU1705839.1 hypothetical protein [Patescibacteria group bacterium]